MAQLDITEFESIVDEIAYELRINKTECGINPHGAFHAVFKIGPENYRYVTFKKEDPIYTDEDRKMIKNRILFKLKEEIYATGV